MQKVLDVTKEYAESIFLLLKDERATQALVLAYSAIDTMAWANKTTGDVKRSDFISWADTYMQPKSALGGNVRTSTQRDVVYSTREPPSRQ